MEPIKLIIGPSPHYHQLKSGQIKYQKSKPANPIWRIVIMDECTNTMHMRFFARQPSGEDIDRIVMGQLSAQSLLHNDIVIPATVERLSPGLQEKFATHGATVYLPAHGFASGSLVGRESDKFLSYLEMSLNGVRESMASCEEIAAAAGNVLGFVTTALWRDDDKVGRKFNIAHEMAHEITRLRGHDPEIAGNCGIMNLSGGLSTKVNISPRLKMFSPLFSVTQASSCMSQEYGTSCRNLK